MVRFTEKTIWLALEKSGIGYIDWAARKETNNGKSLLHVYLELKEDEKSSLSELSSKVKNGLKTINAEFADMEEIMGDDHVVITKLPIGAFDRYIQSPKRSGRGFSTHKTPAYESERRSSKQIK